MMSTFVVAVRKIAKVLPHGNADKLELAEVEGLAYQFVIPKGSAAPGDDVLYIPIDSVLPDELSLKLGVKNYLVGKDKNRVKTAKLRGAISQGIVARPSVVRAGWAYELGVDYKDLLGIAKYDPPPVPCQAGLLKPLPPGVSAYDIESADNFVDAASQLMDLPVFITEKMEGSNWSATRTADGEQFVSQHHYRIEPVTGATHDFWKVAQAQGLLDALGRIAADFGGKQVTLRGEYLGPDVQKNIYKLPKNQVLLFDIEINSEPLDAAAFLDVATRFSLPVVPVLWLEGSLRRWIEGNGGDLRRSSNGESRIAPGVAREGIIIKPLKEQRHPKLGRLFLKQRSPEYLAANDF
jgi:RNA ligase (TIGR02306 family)